MLPIPIVLCIVLIFIVVLVVHCKKHWFIIDTARSNPYKLVYRVTKFARQHKVPIGRSAFTYCENDMPSGLDLDKSKYGGPLTTEEVENVNVFYCFWLNNVYEFSYKFIVTTFFIQVSTWHKHTYFDANNATYVLLTILLKDGYLSSLVAVLFFAFLHCFCSAIY